MVLELVDFDVALLDGWQRGRVGIKMEVMAVQIWDGSSKGKVRPLVATESVCQEAIQLDWSWTRVGSDVDDGGGDGDGENWVAKRQTACVNHARLGGSTRAEGLRACLN